MARKGKEADTQIFVKTDEEWEKLMEPQVMIGSHRHPEHDDCVGCPHRGRRVQ